MKVYEAVFDEFKQEGVYALSVVENPAMQDLWIALNEHPQRVELATVDEEKRLLLGAALIPNKKIYRNIDGNEFYITFKEDTIEKLAHSFFKKQYNNNSSLEHNVKLNGMSVVEGWIVENPNNDKSNNYGKTYEKGTWVTMMKVDNDEVWEKVKSGEVKGFSIDALLSLKPLQLSNNLNTDIVMTEEIKKSIVTDVIDGVKALFSAKEESKEVVKQEVKLEEEEKEVDKELMEDKSEFDAEAFANELEAMAKSLKEAMMVEFKSQLETVVGEKDKEIESLKTELSKQPETNGIKSKGKKEDVAVQLTATTPKGRIYEFLNNRK